MRVAIALGLAVLLGACAHDPPPPAQMAEVPMYTPGEWTEMNSVSSVPEIADVAVLRSNIGSSHFSMHVHTHHFHMHMHH